MINWIKKMRLEKFQSDSRLPRGIRNNNPGNLRISVANWRGKILPPFRTDKDFEQFEAAKWGIRALMKTLKTYIEKYDLNTVEKIINRWAPPSENITTSYVRSVEQEMIPLNPVITWNEAQIVRLATAIIKHENGQMPYTDALMKQAFKLAS